MARFVTQTPEEAKIERSMKLRASFYKSLESKGFKYDGYTSLYIRRRWFRKPAILRIGSNTIFYNNVSKDEVYGIAVDYEFMSKFGFDSYNEILIMEDESLGT